jgi:hypothetical protein
MLVTVSMLEMCLRRSWRSRRPSSSTMEQGSVREMEAAPPDHLACGGDKVERALNPELRSEAQDGRLLIVTAHDGASLLA